MGNWKTRLTYIKGRIGKFSEKITEGADVPDTKIDRAFYDPKGLTFHLVTGSKLLVSRVPKWNPDQRHFDRWMGYLRYTPISRNGSPIERENGYSYWLAHALTVALGDARNIRLGSGRVSVYLSYRADKNRLSVNISGYSPAGNFHRYFNSPTYVAAALEVIKSGQGGDLMPFLDMIADNDDSFRDQLGRLFQPEEVNYRQLKRAACT